MIPKWFYKFNHYAMLVCLGILLLMIAFGLLCLPFLSVFSYRFVCWMGDLFCWAFPIILAIFAATSGVVVSGASEHKIKWRIKDEEEEKEK